MRAEHRYLRYGTRPRHLIVGTATRFCDTGNDSDYGNHLNRLAIANKLDFVHLHGFELWVHDEPVRGWGARCRHCACVALATADHAPTVPPSCLLLPAAP